jgi:hypothetical protein
MNMLVWIFLMQTPEAQGPQLWPAVIESLDRSGRVVEMIASPSERLGSLPLAPGAPPLLNFRYFEGKARYRFGELGLVMDDAGH